MKKSVWTISFCFCVFTQFVFGQDDGLKSVHNHGVKDRQTVEEQESPPAKPEDWLSAGLSVTGNVTIERDRAISLNTDLDVDTLTIEGSLSCARQDLNIRARWIMIHGTGRFTCGSAVRPYLQKLNITLTGNDPNEDVMGMGTKFIGAMMGGRLELYGERRTTWTKLNATAQPGSTQIVLAENSRWRVGEKIVIASSSMRADEAETRTITAVSGNTVTLNQPLIYRHWGTQQTFEGKTLDERAEVGLLTRNIVIQGDEGSVQSRFGGHVMIMNPGSNAKIQGTEFVRMGQFNRLGRYPMHWHLVRNAAGGFFVGNSVYDTIQRGLVVHGTDNLLVKNNVIFNTVGHAYAVEDGSERGNMFHRNLGILPRPAVFTDPGLVSQNDPGAAAFWIRSAANSFIGNISGGGRHAGFWFDLGFIDGANEKKALLVFQDNTVHSHQGANIPGTESKTWAIWHTDGFTPSEEGLLIFENVVAYKNSQAIETAGRGVTRNSILADNGKAFSKHLLRNSTVISRSANDDTDPDWGITGMFAYGDYAHAENVTWVNFTNGRTISRTLACGIEYPRFSMRGSILVNSQSSAGCGDIINRDIDGTAAGTGLPQTLISVEGRPGFPNYGKNRFGLLTAQCQILATNRYDGAAVCPNYDYRAFGVTYPTGSGFENPNWRVDVVRDEDGDRVTPDHFRWISYVIPDKLYHLEVKNKLNPSDPAIYPLTTLAFINLGLSTGDLSRENLLTGGRNAIYDPQWADRYVTVYASNPTVNFRVLRCNNAEPCASDNSPWQQISGATSLSTLQSTRGAGFFVDSTANRIYFKFNGGDRLRFERL